jgi:2-dehydropantoate 2-reductase
MAVEVCIVGTGAVGSIIALSAMLGGCKVLSFSRKEKVIEVNGIIPYRLKIQRIGSITKRCDYVVVSVKSYDIDSTFKYFTANIIDGSVFIVAQNGIGGLERLRDVLKGKVVAAAVVNFGSTRKADYSVELRGQGPVFIGCEGYNCTPFLEPLARCLRIGGLEVTLVDDITKIRKEKLAINAVINALTTLLNVENGYLIENDDIKRLVELLTLDACRVLGLNYKETLHKVYEVIRSTSNNISSMLQDLRDCRPLEVDSIIKPISKNSLSFLIIYRLVKALEKRRTGCYEYEKGAHGGYSEGNEIDVQ